MRPAVYKHCNVASRMGRDTINTASSAQRAAGATPAPTSPSERNLRCRDTVHWTADKNRRVQHGSWRGPGESVQYERTEWSAGGNRVCAALAVTSRGFDSWLADETRAVKSAEAAPRRHRRRALHSPPRHSHRINTMNSDRVRGHERRALPFLHTTMAMATTQLQWFT